MSAIAADGVTVVVTDIDMPGSMDGLGLARSIRKTWPGIAIIVTSGRRLPRPDELPKESAFLAKPFSPERLLSLVTDAGQGQE